MDDRFRQRFKSLVKQSAQHSIENASGIPEFSPKNADEIKRDKYEMNANRIADKYLGLYAYGSYALHLGGSEGLYQSVNSALLAELESRKGQYAVLDLGCGVGRTLYDCAPLFPNSLFVGMDYSERMIGHAASMVKYDSTLKKKYLSNTDFSEFGFGKAILKRKVIPNVILAQGSALDLPFKDNVFDVVINTYLIDRVNDPSRSISEMSRVLRPSGLLVFTDPLNWTDEKFWKKYGDRRKFVSMFVKHGLVVEQWFDGMIYREVQDGWGNYSDWKTLMVKGRKK